MSLGDLGERHAHWLAVGVIEHEHLAFFAQTEAGENLAGVCFDGHHPESQINIAARIERVFEQPIEATVANAVESWSECFAYLADLVAICANTFCKHSATCSRIVLAL